MSKVIEEVRLTTNNAELEVTLISSGLVKLSNPSQHESVWIRLDEIGEIYKFLMHIKGIAICEEPEE
jgi:hypothetical protein